MPIIPAVDPNATMGKVTEKPLRNEVGIHTIGRKLTFHLRRLLGTSIDMPMWRETEFAWLWEMTLDGQNLTIERVNTGYEIRFGDSSIAVKYDRYEDTDWQLAEIIWGALDGETPSER